MTRYAVGDLQGCLEPLQCLLRQVDFNAEQDQLWLVGDLINRGPDSLGTLRFIHNLGDCTRVVLGNHDLHFLAVAFGSTALKPTDTFQDILDAPDRDELINWLRHQPLVYTDPSGDYTMVHAGIPPQWSIKQTHKRAREVESLLRCGDILDFFDNMYGDIPDRWNNQLRDWERMRVITNYLTRMRFCTAEGALDLSNKSNNPSTEAFAPWFSFSKRKTRHNKIVFGHWAALEGKADDDYVFALDTGCVWGNHMTLMNLDSGKLLSCDC